MVETESQSLERLVNQMDDRQKRLFACDCAERVLHVFEPENRDPGRGQEYLTGGLEAGKQADVVLMKLCGEPGVYEAEVKRVFVGGRQVVPSGG